MSEPESLEAPAETLPPDLEAGVLHLRAGHLDAAVAPLEAAARSAERDDAPEVEAAARGALAEAFLGLGRWSDARAQALRAHECAVRVSDRAAADDFAGMVATADGLGRLYPQGGAVDFTATARMDAAILAYKSTRDPAAERAHLQAAVDAAAAGRLMGQEAGLLGGLATILVREGERDAARTALLRAQAIVEVLGQERALAHFTAQLAALGG